MKNFRDILSNYWGTAYREGEERRILDDGAAQETLFWLQAYSREAEANKTHIAELEAQNKHDDEANTLCRNLLCEERDAAEAQCDRYREALEKIADPNRALSYYDELAVIQSIATKALNP